MSDDNTLHDEMQDFNVDDFLGDTPPESLSVPDNIANGDDAQPCGNLPKSPDFKLAKKPDYLNLDGNTLFTAEDGETAESCIWREKLKPGEKVTIHCPAPDHQDEHASAFMAVKNNGNLFWSCSSCGSKGWCNDDKSTDYNETAPSKAAKKKDKEKAPKSDEIVMSIAKGFYLFRDKRKNTYAEVIHNGCKTIMPINSTEFKNELRVACFEEHDLLIGKSALDNTVDNINAIVSRSNNVEIVSRRNYKFDDCVYINVGDESGRIIMVDKHGYRYVTDSKVKFITTSSMDALPEIVFGEGDITLLAKHLNVTEREMPIPIGWMLATLAGVKPYLHLNIRGVAGSSKSGTARILQALVDPSNSFSGAITNVNDFALACENNYLIMQDNLSKVTRPLADIMCIASTGGTHDKRELYTNNDICRTHIHNPLIITIISSNENWGDLLERTATLELPRIPDSTRKDEDELRKAFNQDKPAIFTGLLDMIVSGFKHIESIELDSKPRMADAAKFITACEQESRMSGNFMEVFAENQAMACVDAFDESPACRALISFMETRECYKGPVTKLLNELESHVRHNSSYARGWPATRNALSAILDEFNDRFENIGIHIEKNKRRGTNTVRNYVITNSNYKPANGLKSVTDNSSGSVPFIKLVAQKIDDDTES